MRRKHLLKNILPKNGIGIEIGVFKGQFAKYVVDILKPKMYYMVDPWIFDGEGTTNWYKHSYKKKKLENQNDVNWMYKCICERFDIPNVKIHRGFSYEVIDLFEDNYFDFVYVDGEHTPDAVLQDITLYYPKLKVGGIMAGDDWVVKGEDLYQDTIRQFVDDVNSELHLRENQYWFTKK